MLQNELAKRENDRKTSMSFGYGGGFFTGQSPALGSMMPSGMMPLQFMGGFGMQDDNVPMSYFMGGPF